jgi:hypothetical protein
MNNPFLKRKEVQLKSSAIFASPSRRFSKGKHPSAPVRIIIDKAGAVQHIHFLSAFPDQVKVISDALHQWKFKPYLRDGKPAEVETGVLFGTSPFLEVRKDSASSVE